MISQTRAGVTTWFHNIHNGPTNVSHLTNSSGAVAQKYGFDAFGNITSQTGSTTNNYRFQTKELHPKSKLVYFGARWYNPAVGRWLTPDPLGIADGPNLYVYLNNSPLNDIDPWGLCSGIGGFWGRVASWWKRMYPVRFKWFDVSSWIFPGTRYAGWSKSGPGPTTTRLDTYAQQHDQRLQATGRSWWHFWNREVRDINRDFINNWWQDYWDRHQNVSYNSDDYGYLAH